MENFNPQLLLENMLSVFEKTLEDNGDALIPLLKTEVEKTLNTVVLRTGEIINMVIRKKISKNKADILFKMQQGLTKEFLLTEEGASKILLQKSLNASLNIAKKALNAAI